MTVEPCAQPPPDEDELAQLTEQARRRTAQARATYRKQVKAEALEYEARRIAIQAKLMELNGEAALQYVQHHMATLTAEEIDALTAARFRTIMAERGRASALKRRRARIEKLRARLNRGGDAA